MCEDLFEAATADNVQNVQQVLSLGVDINATDQNGYTALFLACKYKCVKTVSYLLEQRANTEIKDCEKHYTALLTAVENNHKDLVIKLLTHGADINAQSGNGESALFIASNTGNVDMVSILIDHGADINLSKVTGATPLYIAAFGNHVGVVNVLLQHGVGMNICRRDGATPLYIAAKQGHTKVVDALIQAGADMEKKHQSGCTALSRACACKQKQVVDLLCRAGANLNTHDQYGYTVLHKAVGSKSKAVVDILLSHNVHLVKNNNGATALDMAREKNYPDIVAVLEKHFPDDINRHKNQLHPKIASIRKGIVTHKETIVSVLDREHVDFLYAHLVIDDEEKEKIDAQPGPVTKSKELLRILMDKSDSDWVKSFVESLKAFENSKPLTNLIMGNL